MNKDVVNTLNELIETCKDGEYGFNTCAEHTKTDDLRKQFTTRAHECRNAAGELQHLVFEYGGEPEVKGTASGALHRGWVAVLGAVAGSSDYRMLEEAERGEDAALARYRKALKNDQLPDSVRALVQRQMLGVQHNHDQVKALRDACAVKQ